MKPNKQIIADLLEQIYTHETDIEALENECEEWATFAVKAVSENEYLKQQVIKLEEQNDRLHFKVRMQYDKELEDKNLINKLYKVIEFVKNQLINKLK